MGCPRRPPWPLQADLAKGFFSVESTIIPTTTKKESSPYDAQGRGDTGHSQGKRKPMSDSDSTETKGIGSTARFLLPPLAALQFLTIVPPIVRRPFTADEMGRAVGFFPLVGALLGGALAALDWGLIQVLPQEVAAALILAAWVYATGALHLDGFLDACDGLFGGHTPEARLHIMRDERIGAFAMAGGGLLLIVKYAVLAHSPDRLILLLLAPTLARWTMAGVRL